MNESQNQPQSKINLGYEDIQISQLKEDQPENHNPSIGERPFGSENNHFSDDIINGKGFNHEFAAEQKSLIDDRDNLDEHECACWVDDIPRIEWLRPS